MGQKRQKYLLRALITIAFWIVLIIYIPKQAHLFLAYFQEMLSTPALRIFLEIIFLNLAIVLIWLSFPFLPKFTIRRFSMVLFWSCLLAVGYNFSLIGFVHFKEYLGGISAEASIAMLVVAGIIYLLVLSIPFVPGLEIGILIMLIFGMKGVIIAYLATVGGLILAFSAGRFLPPEMTSNWLHQIGLSELAKSPETAMKTIMANKEPGRLHFAGLRSSLFKYRYLTLAFFLNMPCNSVLGGGGGIGFVCGIGRTFKATEFVITIILATALVPLMISLGILQLDTLFGQQDLLLKGLQMLESIFQTN